LGPDLHYRALLAVLDEELLIRKQLEAVQHHDHPVLPDQGLGAGRTSAVGLLVDAEDLAGDLVPHFHSRWRLACVLRATGVLRTLLLVGSIGIWNHSYS
jgi:hypothetical protein